MIGRIHRWPSAVIMVGMFVLAMMPIGSGGGFISEAVAAQHEKAQYSFSVVMRVQRVLAKSGYDPGPIDGLFGPRTAAALKSYQRDNNLPARGVLDDITKRSLGLGS